MMELIRQLLFDGVSQRLTILEQEHHLNQTPIEDSDYLQVLEFLRDLYTQIRLWRYESLNSFQQFWDEELRQDAVLDFLVPLTAQLRVYGFTGWGSENGEWQKFLRALSHSFTNFEGGERHRIMDDDLADRLPQQEELMTIMSNNPILVTVFALYTMPEVYGVVMAQLTRHLKQGGGT